MRLTDEEQAMRSGEFGPMRQWAIEHQIKVGQYLAAEDFVPVGQALIMADTELLGMAGVEWLEGWAKLPYDQRQVRIPTITDPRGTDFAAAQQLKQQPWMLDLERRAIAAFEALGVLMTNTCINYQTIMPPVYGEHVAYGDTGVVIYTNSVCGARSNFEGGPSALSAGITGRTPRYGYHLPERRRATAIFQVSWRPRDLSDWGALGGVIGRLAGDYWQVPAIIGLERVPSSDEMKHFGAALASFGSLALFHMVGITPEAKRLDDVVVSAHSLPTHDIGEAEVRALQTQYVDKVGTVDVVVFSAPQLSLIEMQMLAAMLDGRRVTIPLFAVTSPQVKPDADRMGLTACIESAAAASFPACASIKAMPAKWPRPTAGGGWQAIRRNWSTSSAATATSQHCLRWSTASKPRAPAAGFGDERKYLLCGCRNGPEAASGRAGRQRWLFRTLRSRPHSRRVLAPEHKLAGESYRGRVLVLDAAKGGVATAWMLYEMTARGVMPAALVLNRVNPIMVQGAALAAFTMVSGFDVDITKVIPNGAEVEIDAAAERPFIRILR